VTTCGTHGFCRLALYAINIDLFFTAISLETSTLIKKDRAITEPFPYDIRKFVP
jgi:hypothetical protein